MPTLTYPRQHANPSATQQPPPRRPARPSPVPASVEWSAALHPAGHLDPDDLVRCAAVCRQCTEATGTTRVVAFSTLPARTAWVAAHSDGHDVKLVDGWPPAAVAWARTFGGAS